MKNIMVFKKNIFIILMKIKMSKNFLEKSTNLSIIGNLFQNFISFDIILIIKIGSQKISSIIIIFIL